ASSRSDSSSATGANRQDVLREPIPAGADSVFSHPRRARVPGGERLAGVAELLQQVAQEQQANPYLSFHVPRIATVGQDLLDVVPRSRLDLEDAPGAGARGEVRLMAGLHPGKRAGEPWVDAVVAGPAVDLSADL